VLGLFKFGKRVHMEELVREGLLYMRPLEDFVCMEADEFRADRDEGLAHSFAATGAKLQMEHNGEWLHVGTIVGPIRSPDLDLRKANVFCMHAFRDVHVETMVDPRNLRSADTYVAFTDGDEFIRRVREEAKRQELDLDWRLVEYVDPNTYRGRMGIFRKYSPFSYQSEFRFAILPGTGKPYSLRVGDLSDITMMGDLPRLNERIRVKVPEDSPTSGK
jgi:hypothetical protein